MVGMLSDAEVASMRTTVQGALDVTLPLYRKAVTDDGYGHTTETWNLQGDVLMNIIRPSATQLQVYADVIGSQRALMIRVMDDADVREGDRLQYDSLNWLVQNIQNAESYTVTKEFLITVIA
jgi:head-tail adaptor